MSPAPRRPRLPRELFETRSHAWHSLGLGDELAPRFSKRQFGGLLLALLVIAGDPGRLLPAPADRPRLRRSGSGSAPWSSSSSSARPRPTGWSAASPPASTAASTRRPPAPPASSSACWRWQRSSSSPCGSPASTPAPSRSAAPSPPSSSASPRSRRWAAIFAGIVLQSTRPFRVGERVRLVGGALAGSLEGTVTSLGLFYTTLSQGADRLLVPNNVLLSLVVVPLREPDKVDVRVRFPAAGQPAARSRSGCCGRSPCRPATSPASRSRSSTPTASSSASTRRRCAPRTARSWPRRCWRRCVAREPATAETPQA